MYATIREKKPPKTRFDSLDIGMWFGFGGDIFIKTRMSTQDRQGDAFCLGNDTGGSCKVINFSASDPVHPLEIEVIYS